jgi:hypothetical protein
MPQTINHINPKKSTARRKPKTPEYVAWQHMIQRCIGANDKRFKDYGGRGITVCDEWRHDFMAFFNYIGPRPSKKHSIDRIDNDGNYEPGNIQWSTAKTQSNNNRANHKITINGKTMNIGQWATFTKINRSTLIMRIRRGLSPAEAISKPIIPRGIHIIILHGHTLTVRQWADFSGINFATINKRIKLNWPPAKAIFQKINHIK